jgi:hypothetical protein
MDVISSVRKFIVASVGLAVALAVLDPGTAQTIVGIATAIATYLVPNE